MIVFFICILLTFFVLFFKESKFFAALLFIVMWIFFGWNYSNADYNMYKDMYSILIFKFDFLKYEGGYQFLMYFGQLVGLNFQQFHILIAAIVLFLVFRFFIFFSKLPALSAICFFWIFFPLQFVILRNFIAFSIVLQGLIPVLRNEKYNKQKFIFFVILASTVHISSLFYLLFLFAFKEREIKIKTIGLWVFALLILVIVMHNFIFLILSFAPKARAVFYKTSMFLFLVYSGIQILNLFVVKYFLKLNSDLNAKEDNDYLRMNAIVLNINIIMLFLIPIYYELAVFIRILLNISIVNMVFITNKLFKVNNKFFPKLVFVSYLLFWFFSFIFLVKENTIFPLFNNNLLFVKF